VIDFPLVLQEQPPEAAGANRFVFGPGDWNQLRREFPANPLPADKAPVDLENVRLEWLGKVTCVATLDLKAKRGDITIQGRFMAVLVKAEDGWKVGMATIPM
ncbi:MAG: hypothetical protein HYU66_07580, partial [Armatimonadetes bacterium]|nr:hypothetical protein [Armatimonadota bacterium]